MRVTNCPEHLILQAASKVGVTADIRYLRNRKALGVKLWPSHIRPFIIEGNSRHRTRHKLSLVNRDRLTKIWYEYAPHYDSGTKLHWANFLCMSRQDLETWNLSPTQVLFLGKMAQGLSGTKYTYTPKISISKYQRQNRRHPGRMVAAVCWHGFRDFFRELYRLKSDAHIHTALRYYKNSEHFEEVFPETAGSYYDCCWCYEVPQMEVQL